VQTTKQTNIYTKTIERDTVSPVIPRLNVSLKFNYPNEPYYISATVSGEAFSNSSLLGKLNGNGYAGGVVRYLNPASENDWNRTFTFCTNLTDNASNTSGRVCRSVSTPARPPTRGECEFDENVRDSLIDRIRDGSDNMDMVDQGISRACQQYEPGLVDDILNEAAEEYQNIKSETQSCVQEKKAQGLSNDEVIKECNTADNLGQNTADQIMSNLEEGDQKVNDYQSCIQGAIEGTESDEGISDIVSSCAENMKLEVTEESIAQTTEGIRESIDKIEKELEQEQEKLKKEEESCDWNIRIWRKDNCVNKGANSAIEGIADMAERAWDYVVSVPSVVVGITTAIITAPGNFIGNLIDGEGGVFGDTWNDMVNSYDAGNYIVQETVGDFGRGIIDAAEGLIKGIGQGLDTLLVDNLGSLGSAMGIWDYERRYNLVDNINSIPFLGMATGLFTTIDANGNSRFDFKYDTFGENFIKTGCGENATRGEPNEDGFVEDWGRCTGNITGLVVGTILGGKIAGKAKGVAISFKNRMRAKIGNLAMPEFKFEPGGLLTTPDGQVIVQPPGIGIVKKIGNGIGREFNKKTLLSSANRIDRNGLTMAGRALQKHSSRVGSKFKTTAKNPSSYNTEGLRVLEEILNNPDTAVRYRNHNSFGEIMDFRHPDGRGVRFDIDNNFIGLLD